MWGALYGGLVLGVVMSWGSQLLSGTMVNAVAFALLVVLLAVRPQGIAGKASRRRLRKRVKEFRPDA